MVTERVRGWCHTAPCKWRSCLRTFNFKPQIIKRIDAAIWAHLENILLDGGAIWEVSNVSICREYLEQRNPESKGDRDAERALVSPHRREQSQEKNLLLMTIAFHFQVMRMFWN